MQRADRRGHDRRRAFVAGLTTVLTLVAVLAFTAPARSVGRQNVHRQERSARGQGTFDVRARGTAVRPSARAVKARTALARSLGSQSVIISDDVTGTLRMVGRLDGYLTGPSSRRASDVVMGFVRSNLRAFGLTRADLQTFHLRQDYVDIAGTHHISWTQSLHGISVFHNGLRAAVTKHGRLVNVTGSPVHGLRVSAGRPRISSAAAIAAARADGGARLHTAQRGDSAALTLFPTGRGARLAWRTFTWPSTQQLNLSVVDALSGAILYRQSLTSDATGTATAWEFYPSAIVPPGANLANPVTFPVQDGASLSGSNAHVWADVLDNNQPDPGEEIPAQSGLDWTMAAVLDTTNTAQNCTTARPCTWDKNVPFSWQTNMAQNAAQVMHFLNKYHDHLAGAPYGFTAAAGNFELSGGDPVIGNTMDGANSNNGLPDKAHFDNANMNTPPDGFPPVMQMYLFRAAPGLPIPSSNGGDDAEVVYHEYTHGLSNRLVLFPDGNSGLTTQQAGSMGEGWSDWYAEDFLNNQGFKPDTAAIGDVVMGNITFGGFLRSEAVDCPIGAASSACPGTDGAGPGGYSYGDFGHVVPFPEVHADGEIWLQTLWQVRQALGATTTEALVTRAMELSPAGPSFLDMRNAILQADLVNFAGANQAALWAIFAERGMGYFAASTGDGIAPIEDFSIPVDCATSPCGTISGKITDKSSGKALSGVDVGVAGLNSGFGWDLAATTGSNGTFTIADVPFHTYPLLQVTRKAYEPIDLTNVVVDGDETLNSKLVRDWAALEGGAKLKKFSPPDYAEFCGVAADGAFDLSLGSGWPSDAVGSDAGSNFTGPRKVTVKLAKVVDITSFALASGGTCGDGPEAGVKKFRIQTRGKNGGWVTAITGSVAANGEFNVFKAKTGSENVLYVRFTMLSNHGDPLFMDMLELSVRGR